MKNKFAISLFITATPFRRKYQIVSLLN